MEKEQNVTTSNNDVNGTESTQNNSQVQKLTSAPTDEQSSTTATIEEVDYTAVQEQNESLVAENEKLNEEMVLMKSKVREEYKDDVIILAKARMNDDCNFDKAVQEVKERHQNFFSDGVRAVVYSSATPGGTPSGFDHDAFVAGIKNAFLGGKI